MPSKNATSEISYAPDVVVTLVVRILSIAGKQCDQKDNTVSQLHIWLVIFVFKYVSPSRAAVLQICSSGIQDVNSHDCPYIELFSAMLDL